jgi:hypothetical protein
MMGSSDSGYYDRETGTTEALIARRTARGYRADESRVLLADLLRSLRGDNLAQALVYEGFATERQAYSFVAAQTWTPQTDAVIDDRGRWWPAEPVELTFLPPVIRDVWSDDPDRLTRRGVV